LLTLGLGTLVRAQEIASGVPQDPAKKNAPAPCLQPPPLLSWQDYQGPFQKVVGAFARKLSGTPRMDKAPRLRGNALAPT
jgi:hypothetical protein